MKKFITTAALCCAALMVPGVTRADDQADLDKVSTELNERADSAEGRQKVLEAISKETGVPVATLEDQKAKTGFGYGELLIGNSLATASGKTFDELAALKTGGKGWGEIAKSLGVKVGDVVGKGHRVAESTRPAGDKGKPPPDVDKGKNPAPGHAPKPGKSSGGGGGRGK